MQVERRNSALWTSYHATNTTSSIKRNDFMGSMEKDQSVQILNIIGEKGFYQMMVAGLCLMSSIISSWNVLGYTFFIYPMDYWCARPSLESFKNLTVAEWKNLSTISKSVNVSGKCFMYEIVHEDGNFSRTGQTVKCEDWEFQDRIFRQTIVSKWDLVCEHAFKTTTSQTVYLAGSLLSVLLFGQLADCLGRRPVLLLGIALYLVAGLVTSQANSFIFFVFCRFFVAFGIHGTTMTAFVVLMECIGSKYRPLYYLSLSIGWAIGYTTIPGLAFITKDWAYLQLSFVIFGLLLVPFWWFCMESPRWLLTQGKYVTAEAVIVTMAKRNRIWKENTHVMIQRIILTSDKEPKPHGPNKASLFHLLRTSNMRRRTLIMFYIWFATSFVYYGITLNLVDFVCDIFANTAIFGAMELLSAVLGFVCFSLAMRRPTSVALFLFVGILCFCSAGIPDSLRWLQSTLSAVGKVAIEVGFDLAYIYSAEIFPTVVRNAGIGSCSAVAGIGSIVAPFMKNMISTTGRAVPLSIFGVVTTVAGLLAFFLPETKNAELQDTLNEEDQCGNFRKIYKIPGKKPSVTGVPEATKNASKPEPTVPQ